MLMAALLSTYFYNKARHDDNIRKNAGVHVPDQVLMSNYINRLDHELEPVLRDAPYEYRDATADNQVIKVWLLKNKKVTTFQSDKNQLYQAILGRYCQGKMKGFDEAGISLHLLFQEDIRDELQASSYWVNQSNCDKKPINFF